MIKTKDMRNVKKLLLILMLGMLGVTANSQTSVGAMMGFCGYYKDYGASFSRFEKSKVGVYADLRLGQYKGVYEQMYRHYTGHVGIIYDWHDFVDPYIAVGLHSEFINWDEGSQSINAFNVGMGLKIGPEDGLISFQLGSELDFTNGMGVNIVVGLAFKL